MPDPLLAFAVGAAGGSALLLGAGIAWIWTLPRRVVGLVMAFGSGVLLSAIAFELLEPAVGAGGPGFAVGGFLAGAVLFVAASTAVDRLAARRSGSDSGEGGTSIALGALLDGVPESIVLGLSVLTAGTVSPALLGAVLLSNVPEGLSSTAQMKSAGHRPGYVFGVWGAIALLSGLSSLLGYAALQSAPDEVVSVLNALAAGAVLAMIVDTMIPEAFDEEHFLAGIVVTGGFATSMVLGTLG